MKIKATPKEIADLIEEFKSRHDKKQNECSAVFIHKDGCKLTYDRNEAKLDACGNPFIAHF